MNNCVKNQTVLVTGADGFIGSHLVERLVSDGASVRALVYYNSWNSLGWLSEIPIETLEKCDVVFGDIRDSEFILELVKDCSYVFHLSSLIGIPFSYVAPRSYVETNVIGALNVLEACRKSASLQRLIHVSTSEVYGSAQTVPIAESHPLVGQSPYSASKIGADHLVDSYFRSFSLPMVIARPFNTFGPRQTARAVIPAIATQLIAGCNELKMGALTPTRDFNFVTDTVAGLLALAACEAALGKTINIGSGEEWSIEKTAKMLMEICGVEVPIVSDEDRLRPLKSEVNRLVADNQLLQDLTGWQRCVDFETGLRLTVEWIRKNQTHFGFSRYAI
ncbi:SDR family NAD(P)-dependent oxidoreductase [Burkholderiales bacterium]|nr:SDR family NAD(P)-dependent oxidoreductase [Burkholderiales bacterium]